MSALSFTSILPCDTRMIFILMGTKSNNNHHYLEKKGTQTPIIMNNLSPSTAGCRSSHDSVRQCKLKIGPSPVYFEIGEKYSEFCSHHPSDRSAIHGRTEVYTGLNTTPSFSL